MEAGGVILGDHVHQSILVKKHSDYKTMYTREPTKDISVTDFIRLGQLRREILLEMETIGVTDERWSQKERKLRADTIGDPRSHYVLALLHCNTEDSRKRFMVLETRLFEYRMKHDVQSVARANGIVPPESDENFPEAKGAVYPVPFVEALKLVENRKCEVINGIVMVPETHLHERLVQMFRKKLEARLEKLKKMYDQYQRDEMKSRQMGYILEQIKVVSTQEVKDQSVGNITPEAIPTLVNPSFPLCMSNLYSGLVADSHLRHEGRRQFGLFLKGIGMSLESSLDFWRKAFSKNVPSDKFDKAYAYNIRHIYGREGKCVKYPPMGCHKIIDLPQPMHNEHHGCPYKTLKGNKLKHLVEQRLSSHIVDRMELNVAVREVVELSEGEHYQLACQKVFACTHDNLLPKAGLNHPNTYFRESFEYLLAKKDKKAVDVSNRMMSASSVLLAQGFDTSSDPDMNSTTHSAPQLIDPKSANLLDGFEGIDLEDLVKS